MLPGSRQNRLVGATNAKDLKQYPIYAAKTRKPIPAIDWPKPAADPFTALCEAAEWYAANVDPDWMNPKGSPA